MNWRGARALIVNTWLSWMQHRGFFFLLAFVWMVPPMIYLLVWMTAAGGGSIGDFKRETFVSYYLVLIVVNQLTYATTNWTVGDYIRYGNMNVLLMRPISPIFDALAQEFAGKVVFMAFIGPVVLILGLLLKPDINLTLEKGLQFLLSLGMAWVLRFLWGYWIALLAFWSTRSDSLLAVQDAFIFLLAGQVAPVVLLPGVLQKIAVYLPFRYMIGLPVEILTGNLSRIDIQLGFAFQTGWLIITIGLFALIWQNGVKQYSAVGG